MPLKIRDGCQSRAKDTLNVGGQVGSHQPARGTAPQWDGNLEVLPRHGDMGSVRTGESMSTIA